MVEPINGIPMLVDAIDVPVLGSGPKARIDAIAVASWLGKHSPATCFCERAQAFPGQGALERIHLRPCLRQPRNDNRAVFASRWIWSRPAFGSVDYIFPVKIKKRPAKKRFSYSRRSTLLPTR